MEYVPKTVTPTLRLPTILWLCCFLATGACSTTPDKPPLMASMVDDTVTVNQLRAKDYAYASRFGQLVSTCAIDIIEQTEDPKLRERAMQWRMYAASQARRAAFNQDPLSGLLELWALAGQQRRYFSDGDGKALLTDATPCVLATARQLEEEIQVIAAEVMTHQDMEDITIRIDRWVDNHPIEGRMFVRDTAHADLAALVGDQTHGGLKAVGSIEETFRDVNDRLAILSTEMPLEMRWQVRYVGDMLFSEHLDEPAADVAAMGRRVNKFLDEIEELIPKDREALFEAFQAERDALLEALGREREVILNAVTEERTAIFSALDEQVATSLGELDLMSRSLIDHFFVRLVQLLVVAGLLGLLAYILLRRRQRAAPPQGPSIDSE